MDFLSGLKVAKVTNYLLIHETDAMAITFGYNRSLVSGFEKPLTVLFVGVGFIESQAFVVRYSQVEKNPIFYIGSIRNPQL